MIESIEVYDEWNVPACISIFWYWQEPELSHHLLDKMNLIIDIKGSLDSTDKDFFIDNHLYLDYGFFEEDNRDNLYSIESITGKVTVYDTLQELEANKDGFYCDYMYSNSKKKFMKMDHSLFSKMTMVMAKEAEKGHFIGNDVTEVRKLFKKTFADKMRSDSTQKSTSENEDEKKNEEGPTITRLCDAILTEMEEIKDFDINEQKEIEDICEILEIEQGPKVNVKLHGFTELGHIGVYRLIWRLITDPESNKIGTQILNEMSVDQLRDIKEKIYCIDQVSEIWKKLGEMRRNYEAWQNIHEQRSNEQCLTCNKPRN